MSKPISGIFSAALALFIALPGCSAETPAPDPTTAATDSITETETTPRWTVVIDPPKGWLLAYPRTPYDTSWSEKATKKEIGKAYLLVPSQTTNFASTAIM